MVRGAICILSLAEVLSPPLSYLGVWEGPEQRAAAWPEGGPG